LVLGVNSFQKHLLRILVRNVLDHNCGALIVPLNNQLQIQSK
jgi:hypothetical protein